MAASVVVNKVGYDFASLEVHVAAGTESFGILEDMGELEYNTTINRETFYGTGRIPRVRTAGRAEYEASVTMARYWFNYLIQKAKALGVAPAMLSMVWVISYTDPTNSVDVFSDTLTGLALKEIQNSHSAGEENLMVTVPLDPLGIYYDGVDCFGNTL